MTVVSDTSPINYLVLIELQDLLPALFEHVLIPGAVRRELQSPEAPQEIRRWMASRPSWLEFREVATTPPDLRQLDDGELEAIALALTTATTLILLDEKKGRQAARERGLSVAGTLGVIDLAARRGLVNLLDALKKLEGTTFRASPQLIRAIIERSSSPGV
jgi:predicted nucleic acid-binding protein